MHSLFAQTIIPALSLRCECYYSHPYPGSENSARAIRTDSLTLKNITLWMDGHREFDVWIADLTDQRTNATADSYDDASRNHEDFLARYPFCYVIWDSYARLALRVRGIADALAVFGKAIESAGYCLQLWQFYLKFIAEACVDEAITENPLSADMIPDITATALHDYVGEDYCSTPLWLDFLNVMRDRFESISDVTAAVQLEAELFGLLTRKIQLKDMKVFVDMYSKLVVLISRAASTALDACLHSHDIVCLEGEDPADVFARHSNEAIATFDAFASTDTYTQRIELERQVEKRLFYHNKPLSKSVLSGYNLLADMAASLPSHDSCIKYYERLIIVCCDYPSFWYLSIDFCLERVAHCTLDAQDSQLEEFVNQCRRFLERATRLCPPGKQGFLFRNAKLHDIIGDMKTSETLLLEALAMGTPFSSVEHIRYYCAFLHHHKRTSDAVSRLEHERAMYKVLMDETKTAQLHLSSSDSDIRSSVCHALTLYAALTIDFLRYHSRLLECGDAQASETSDAVFIVYAEEIQYMVSIYKSTTFDHSSSHSVLVHIGTACADLVGHCCQASDEWFNRRLARLVQFIKSVSIPALRSTMIYKVQDWARRTGHSAAFVLVSSAEAQPPYTDTDKANNR